MNYEQEYIKCMRNPLYFIENYVKVEITGPDPQPICSEQWKKIPHYRLIVESVFVYENVVLLASRQTGKTTTILSILLHSIIFFPGIKISFITLDKNYLLYFFVY